MNHNKWEENYFIFAEKVNKYYTMLINLDKISTTKIEVPESFEINADIGFINLNGIRKMSIDSKNTWKPKNSEWNGFKLKGFENE